MSDQHDTYENRAEYLRAVADPAYAQSSRYRGEVAAKLQRSMDAGTVTPMGQHITHGQGSSFHTRYATRGPEAIYGAGTPMPKAEPAWAEAAKVGAGYFHDPEAIAAAMGAPHFDADPSYRRAVSEKIERSISKGLITPDLVARDRSGTSE